MAYKPIYRRPPYRVRPKHRHRYYIPRPQQHRSIVTVAAVGDEIVIVVPQSVFSGGGVTLTPELWLADVNGFPHTNLTEYITDGAVTMNVDQSIKMSCAVTVRDPENVNPYVDYLNPRMRISYHDGTADDYTPLGFYAIAIPPGDYMQNASVATFQGYDMTSLAFSSLLTDTYTMGAGTDPITFVKFLLVAAGLTRWSFPSSGETMGSTVTRQVRTKRGDICNDNLQLLGWYTMHMGLDGYITSAGLTRDLQHMEPFVTLTNDDIFSDTFRVIPSDQQVCNISVVKNDNAAIQPPLYGYYANTDAASPTSTVNIGERFCEPEWTITGPTTQAALDRRAKQQVNEGRTYYRTAELSIAPTHFEALRPHQTVDLNCTGRLEPFSGRWWVRNATMGLTPDSSLVKLTISQVVMFDGSIV